MIKIEPRSMTVTEPNEVELHNMRVDITFESAADLNNPAFAAMSFFVYHGREMIDEQLVIGACGLIDFYKETVGFDPAAEEREILNEASPEQTAFLHELIERVAVHMMYQRSGAEDEE